MKPEAQFESHREWLKSRYDTLAEQNAVRIARRAANRLKRLARLKRVLEERGIASA